mgnify:CR=1 FL=1
MVNGRAFPLEQDVGHPSPSADILSCDLVHSVSEPDLLPIDDLGVMLLAAAVFARHTAHQLLGLLVVPCLTKTALRRRSGIRSFPRKGP